MDGIEVRRRRGFTYIEVLIALVLLSIVAAASIASWSISVRAPVDKRASEMGIYIAVSEIERLKAMKYDHLGISNDNVSWYDRYGAYVGGTQGSTGFYKAKYSITLPVPNLKKITVKVYNVNESVLLEPPLNTPAPQTLLTREGL